MFNTDYDKILHILKSKKKSFKIERKRSFATFSEFKTNRFLGKSSLSNKSSEKTVFNKITKESKINKAQAISLFGQVKKSVNDFIIQNDFIIPYVSKVYPTTYINIESIKKLRVNDEFYYIDVNHCYWRIAYLLGVIPENLYRKCVDNDGYKTFRNASLAMIVAPKEVDYYINGELLHSVSEVTSIYSDVYEYIRHTVHDILGTICFDKLNETNCIGYVVDAVMVKKQFIDIVKENLEMYNLGYTLTKCKVISETEFIFNVDSDLTVKEVRRF